MAFVAAPNIVMTEFRYLQDGQRTENRIMIDNLAAVDSADLTAIAVAAWNWWDGTYSPLISSIVTLREIVCTDLTVQNGIQYTYAPDTTTTGGNTGGAVPNEVSLCLSLRSGSRGRSARGRWFIAGIPKEALATTNNVSSAYANDTSSALQDFVDAIDGLGKKAVVVSYRTNNAPRVGGPVYFVISSVIVTDNVVDSQRKRKPGVGS